ncbi:MAG: hypothetical protein R3B47_18780 [Bacteroidia bacterium]
MKPDGDGYAIDRVTFEAHGDAHDYSSSEVDIVDDSHVAVWVGLNQHPHYNNHRYGGETIKIVENYRMFQVIDVVSDEGTRWQPWTESEDIMREIGLRDGEPINDQKWVKFSGRLGVHVDPELNSAEYLSGGDLSAVDWGFLKGVGGYGINDIAGKIPDEDGPGGINNRGTRPWAFLD